MNGKVSWYDGVDIDVFSLIELKDMFTKLGYKDTLHILTLHFHFDFAFPLHILNCSKASRDDGYYKVVAFAFSITTHSDFDFYLCIY